MVNKSGKFFREKVLWESSPGRGLSSTIRTLLLSSFNGALLLGYPFKEQSQTEALNQALYESAVFNKTANYKLHSVEYPFNVRNIRPHPPKVTKMFGCSFWFTAYRARVPGTQWTGDVLRLDLLLVDSAIGRRKKRMQKHHSFFIY